jgi:hypothetical protein
LDTYRANMTLTVVQGRLGVSRSPGNGSLHQFVSQGVLK